MAKIDACKSGSFKIGGDIEICRLGFGAMRITGPRVWGPPLDRAEAVRTLKRLPELGINFVDTADSYGPEVSEQLIHETLHPYDGILIATKAGLTRPDPQSWKMDGRPSYLRDEAIKSCRRLGLKQIGLWQLHRIDPKVPRDEQFVAIKSLQDEGIIRHAGLSNVSIADIEAASKVFKVATVQNRYNLVDRGSEDVVDYCQKHRIGFIPYRPLATGGLAKSGSILDARLSPMTLLRARSRLLGCSNVTLSCCPFRAHPMSRTWKTMSLPSTSSFRMKSSMHLIAKDGQNTGGL